MKRYTAKLNGKKFSVFTEDGAILLEVKLGDEIIKQLASILYIAETDNMKATGKEKSLLEGYIENAYIKDNNLFIECIVYSSHHLLTSDKVKALLMQNNFQATFEKEENGYKNTFIKVIPIKEESQDNV